MSGAGGPGSGSESGHTDTDDPGRVSQEPETGDGRGVRVPPLVPLPSTRVVRPGPPSPPTVPPGQVLVRFLRRLLGGVLEAGERLRIHDEGDYPGSLGEVVGVGGTTVIVLGSEHQSFRVPGLDLRLWTSRTASSVGLNPSLAPGTRPVSGTYTLYPSHLVYSDTLFEKSVHFEQMSSPGAQGRRRGRVGVCPVDSSTTLPPTPGALTHVPRTTTRFPCPAPTSGERIGGHRSGVGSRQRGLWGPAAA